MSSAKYKLGNIFLIKEAKIKNTLYLYFRLWELLSKQIKWSVGWLVPLIIFVGILDVLGLASIFPLIAYFTSPEDHSFFSSLNLGENLKHFFLLLFGIFVILGIICRVLLNYYQLAISLEVEKHFSLFVFRNLLRSKFKTVSSLTSNNATFKIISEVHEVVVSSFLPALTLISSGIIIVFILGALLVIEPYVSILIGFSLASVFGTVFFFLRARLRDLGRTRLSANRYRYEIVADTFLSLRETRVYRIEGFCEQEYSKALGEYFYAYKANNKYSQIPRFLVEFVVAVGIFAAILVFVLREQLNSEILVYLGLYVVAAYRLLPSLNQFYASLLHLRFSVFALKQLLDLLGQVCDSECEEVSAEMSDAPQSTRSMCSGSVGFKAEQLSFSHSLNSDFPSISDISFYLPAASSLAIVGPSGSGKSTLVDLLLGLSEPLDGRLYACDISGRALSDVGTRDIKFGYVPHNTIIYDRSVVENIALEAGSAMTYDRSLVSTILEVTKAEEFVDRMPGRLNARCGPAGKFLSSGQRQRLGIGRALYREPQVVIFDEATAALDSELERCVIEGIRKFRPDLTIISVTHSCERLQIFDYVLELNGGRVEFFGPSSEYLNY